MALAGYQEFFQSSRRNLVFADLFQQVTFRMLIASVLEVRPKINKKHESGFVIMTADHVKMQATVLLP